MVPGSVSPQDSGECTVSGASVGTCQQWLRTPFVAARVAVGGQAMFVRYCVGWFADNALV